MVLLHDFAENSCTDGHVRLVGGLVDYEGTVELCQNGSWNSLCDIGWGYQEAFVVCRQLGLPATGKYERNFQSQHFHFLVHGSCFIML